MKLKDIKGLLPEKKTYLINKLDYPANILKAHNDCLDLLAEREIEVSVCEECGGSGNKDTMGVGDNMDVDFVPCLNCTNGVIIKVKES